VFGELRIWWLAHRLKSASPRVREEAAKALGQTGDSRAVKPLVALSVDKMSELYPYVRSAVYSALAELGMAAIPELASLLKDRSSDIRRASIAAIPGVADAQILKALTEALDDGDAEVRRIAAFTLGNIRDVRSIQHLAEALKDQSSDVRRAAASALGMIGDVQGLHYLVKALKDQSSSVRCAAASAVVKIGDPQAVEPLISAFQDNNDQRMRLSLALALAKFRDPRVVDHLATQLKSGCTDLMEDIVQALGEIGDERAVEALAAYAASYSEPRGWPPTIEKTIQQVLEKSAHTCTVQALMAFAQLKDRKWTREIHNSGHANPEDDYSVTAHEGWDFSRVRQLAHQELIRRREASVPARPEPKNLVERVERQPLAEAIAADKADRDRRLAERRVIAAARGVYRDGDRCPHCGFGYAWDGSYCSHCDAKGAGR